MLTQKSAVVLVFFILDRTWSNMIANQKKFAESLLSKNADDMNFFQQNFWEKKRVNKKYFFLTENLVINHNILII